MTIGLGPNGGGVLRLVRPGVLLHFCEACGCGHVIDVHGLSRDSRVTGWDGCFDKPSFGEPVRHEKEGAICEYILRGGVMFYLEQECERNPLDLSMG